ncbi:Aminopeptidase 2 mitochondrial [Entophlyctis sp. JEL0112]|nr:Aminopeptidase 2 mitochondrial [Entophlyctis sp. JEL0112]
MRDDSLPAVVVPEHYQLRLVPDLSAFVFAGSVRIHLRVLEETSAIVINQKNLTVASASVHAGDDILTPTSIECDAVAETVAFQLPRALAGGSSAILAIEFSGVHSDSMAGFYRSSYVDADGNKKYLVVTQFESADCRQAFPCFDEPALKATFDCSLVVPAGLTALANMNEVSSVEFADPSGALLKEVTFARTPRMSTYLVAFCVGEFESIERVAVPKSPANAEPVHVRLFTVPGLVKQGEFALDVAVRVHEFFSEYFDEAFPLPKSDLVAVPDFAAGAMENWGLVTYRNVCLLCDLESATASAKREIANVVAHELAHQWFGNLVTMKWWNDLWLNEGFATFVAWFAVDHLFPEWNVWPFFINSEFSQALQLDSLRSSHPIDVEVKSAKAVDEIFDAISYSKGATVITMLNEILGTEAFISGVRTYLQEFKYKNAVTADLWRHLSASSGKDVAKLMHSWTKETGYPLITVESQSYESDSKTVSVVVTQSRFLSAGDLTEEDDKVIWWVPITALTNLHGKSNPSVHILSEKTGTLTFPYEESSHSFWKLNAGGTSLYRVKYPPEQIRRISHILETNPESFTVGDRMMFLADAVALTVSGLSGIGVVLDLIGSLAQEQNYNVLETISETILRLLDYFYQEPTSVLEGIRGLGRKVFCPKVEKLGFDFSDGEDYFDRLTRGLAIKALVYCNDTNVAVELKRRFDLFAGGDKSALHEEIRVVAFASVLRNVKNFEEAESAFENVLRVYKDPNTQPEEKDETLRVLGGVNSMEHIDRLLNTIIFDTEIVKTQDVMQVLVGVVRVNGTPIVTRPLLREWFKNKWDVFYPRMRDAMGILGAVMSLCFVRSAGEEVLEEIEGWVSGEGLDEAGVQRRREETAGITRRIEQIRESVASNTKIVVRERAALADYFRG